MKRRYRQPATILVLFAVSLLSFSCSHPHQKTDAQMRKTMDKLEHLIADTVKDPARARRLTDLARQADQQTQELSGLEGDYRQRMKALNKRYDAARTEFDVLEASYTAHLSSRRTEIIDTWFAMQSTAAKDEWEKIAKHEAQALMERLSAKQ